MTQDGILYHAKSSVKVGEVERYVITYQLYDEDEGLPADLSLNSLWLKVRNLENFTFRAAYLMGPYILYCDVRTEDYHHSQRLFVSADQPKFEPMLQPQQDFIAELSLHNLKKTYVWVVDVVSQIIFTNTTQIGFEVSIGSSKKCLSKSSDCDPMVGSCSPKLNVTKLNTLDIWNLPNQLSTHASQKEHLVLLTHGLHSNVPADLFYLKEQIEKCQKYYPDEQIVVKGYDKNVCKTEKGIKYLGTRMAEYIVNELYHDRVVKISFIGHSLGGLVQTFAIAYISVKYPWFFQKVEPINFITLASPLLGIVTDNPAYVNILLSFGIVGKTGQDLGLKESGKDGKPLLYCLPGEQTKRILKMFKRRTLYANAVNDGIVPLYSASLLFADYEGVVNQLKGMPEFQDKLRTTAPGDYIKRNFLSPLTKAISIWAPQKFPEETESKLPKVSVIESATSVLIPPLPDKAYVMDPSSRENVILHDRIYSEKDIPPRNSQSEKDLIESENVLLKAFTMSSEKHNQTLEEDIARKWHEGLVWRKVIVGLKPDAHNNIIVRRRFANAYGWPIIDHLTQNHFNGAESETAAHGEAQDRGTSSSPVQENDENKDIGWLDGISKPSMFDVGPTGMISTVGEIIDSLSKNNFLSKKSTTVHDLPAGPFEQQDLFSYEMEEKDLA